MKLISLMDDNEEYTRSKMDWRQLSKVTLGHEPTSEFVEPYTASLTYFAITMIGGILLRTLNKVFTPEFAQSFMANFISTLEMCAYFFENNFILKYYGSLAFFVVIIVQLLISNRTFGGSSENPVKALHEYLHGHMGISAAVANIVIQTFAGIASYRYAKMIWSLDLIADHHERYHETDCEADLHVTLFVGLGLELCACLTETWLSMQTLLSTSIVDEVVKCSVSSLMITFGIHLTGMYINPAMASGHTFGCGGVAALDHFAVYWLGPFVGCFIAVMLDKKLHIDRSVSAAVEKDRKKKKE